MARRARLRRLHTLKIGRRRIVPRTALTDYVNQLAQNQNAERAA